MSVIIHRFLLRSGRKSVRLSGGLQTKRLMRSAVVVELNPVGNDAHGVALVLEATSMHALLVHRSNQGEVAAGAQRLSREDLHRDERALGDATGQERQAVVLRHEGAHLRGRRHRAGAHGDMHAGKRCRRNAGRHAAARQREDGARRRGLHRRGQAPRLRRAHGQVAHRLTALDYEEAARGPAEAAHRRA